MKILKKILIAGLGIAAVGAAVWALKQVLSPAEPATSQYTPPAAEPSAAPATEGNEFDESELGGDVSEELLSILVDPADKGDLELSDDGKWLVNPRNGYRYPIRRGIPVMLIEEGKKHQDESLIRDEAQPAETA